MKTLPSQPAMQPPFNSLNQQQPSINTCLTRSDINHPSANCQYPTPHGHYAPALARTCMHTCSTFWLNSSPAHRYPPWLACPVQRAGGICRGMFAAKSRRRLGAIWTGRVPWATGSSSNGLSGPIVRQQSRPSPAKRSTTTWTPQVVPRPVQASSSG